MALTIKNCGSVKSEGNVVNTGPGGKTRIILEFDSPLCIALDELLTSLPEWCRNASVTVEGVSEPGVEGISVSGSSVPLAGKTDG